MTTAESLPRCQVRAALDLFRDMGGDEFVAEMIGLLLQQTPIQFRLMHESVVAGDAATIKRLAHTMKSSFANFGAQELRRQAQDLEFASHHSDGHELAENVRRLEGTYAEFVQRLHVIKAEFA